MEERRFEWSGRLFFGLVILTLGVVFLLGQYDLVDAARIIEWWPVLLVVVGLLRILGIQTLRRPLSGTVFLVVGVVLLALNLDWVRFDLSDLWPVALILAGGSILVRSLRGPGPGAGAGDTSEWLRSFAFWSGLDRKSASERFRGGELTAIMGGVDLDLRAAKLEGGRAIVDVFVWWGGIEIRVPEDWKVSNEGLAIMGAVEDSTKPAPEGVNTLVLRGLVVMGGVEVKN